MRDWVFLFRTLKTSAISVTLSRPASITFEKSRCRGNGSRSLTSGTLQAARVAPLAALAAGIRLIARSASAVIVSEGFTPGFAEMAEPSTT